jgi:hypothetical protein
MSCALVFEIQDVEVRGCSSVRCWCQLLRKMLVCAELYDEVKLKGCSRILRYKMKDEDVRSGPFRNRLHFWLMGSWLGYVSVGLCVDVLDSFYIYNSSSTWLCALYQRAPLIKTS